MNCETCGKPLKENTDGNSRYCQGHSILRMQCQHINYTDTLDGGVCNDCGKVLEVQNELPDNISICTECEEKSNDDKDTIFDNEAKPFHRECSNSEEFVEVQND